MAEQPFRDDSQGPANDHTAYITVVEQNRRGFVYLLDPHHQVTVGRGSNNRIVLEDDICSRSHCEIFWSLDSWVVRDRDSRNGTYIGNQLVAGDCPLRDGDVIRLGTTEVHFRLPDRAADTLPSDRTLVQRSPAAAELAAQNAAADLEMHRVVHRLPANAGSLHVGDFGRVYHLALRMGLARSTAELGGVVLDSLLEATGANIGALLICTGGSVAAGTTKVSDTDFKLSAYRSKAEEPYEMVSTSLTRLVLAQQDAVVVDDVATDKLLSDRDSLGEMHARSVLCTPIFNRERLMGLIHLYSANPENPLNDSDLEHTVAIAGHLGVALANLADRESLIAGLQVAKNEANTLRKQLADESEIVGSSAPIVRLANEIRRVAPTDATALIRGESGVGKELVARAIHRHSRRAGGPFVCLNCAALSESLLESELFGHEKGSFTGATSQKAGKFEQANQGTLFLDEVGEMSAAIQAKFLRVLEGHPFERVGGGKQIRVDVRVVSATNRDLEEAVRDGRFRKDLYFRLNVVDIQVPSLRSRGHDVLILARHFISRIANKLGRPERELSAAAERMLLEQAWPGNVRELRNTIERAFILAEGDVIEPTDIRISSFEADLPGGSPLERRAELGGDALGKPLEDVERDYILATLESMDWNKSQAALSLGIERSTLDRKLKRYGVSRPD